MKFKLILSIILAGIIIAFAVLNAKAVEINYFFGTFSLSLSLLMFLLLAVGILSGALINSFTVKKKAAEQVMTEKESKPKKKEKNRITHKKK